MPRLYVLATPIGNLSDMTPRMREVFEACDLVAAEDTRVTAKLLAHAQLARPMISCHEHNEAERAKHIVRRMLEENLCVALCCDAGTPAVSDPGYRVVREAWEAGVEVIPISGPSAAVTALSASGFDAREFAFYGFLPREKKKLAEKLCAIARSGPRVAVLYESPHRVVALMQAVARELPEAAACVCCDLTKKFEKITRGPARDVAAILEADEKVEKGEYCVVLDLSAVTVESEPQAPGASLFARMLDLMHSGMSGTEAAETMTQQGHARNEVYRTRVRVQQILRHVSDEDGGQ